MAASRFFEVAEELAREELSARGFDAILTGAGADGGLDVVDDEHGLAAQVKATQTPVGAPVLQQLVGAGSGRGCSTLVCFSLSGYSTPAFDYAEQADIALFGMDLRGVISPLNASATGLRASPAIADGFDAFLLGESADDDQTKEHWFRVSLALGEPRALPALWVVLAATGRIDEADSLQFDNVEDDVAADGFVRLARDLVYCGDKVRAAKWAQRAADMGSTAAMVELGRLLEADGQTDRAGEMFERGAIAEFSNPSEEEMGARAAIAYADYLVKARRVNEAMRWYLEGAFYGDTTSIVRLDETYRDWGVAARLWRAWDCELESVNWVIERFHGLLGTEAVRSWRAKAAVLDGTASADDHPEVAKSIEARRYSEPPLTPQQSANQPVPQAAAAPPPASVSNSAHAATGAGDNSALDALKAETRLRFADECRPRCDQMSPAGLYECGEVTEGPGGAAVAHFCEMHTAELTGRLAAVAPPPAPVSNSAHAATGAGDNSALDALKAETRLRFADECRPRCDQMSPAGLYECGEVTEGPGGAAVAHFCEMHTAELTGRLADLRTPN